MNIFGLLTPRRAEKPVKKMTTYSKYSHQSSILSDSYSDSASVSPKRRRLGSDASTTAEKNNALAIENSSLAQRFVEEDKENTNAERRQGVDEKQPREATKPDHRKSDHEPSNSVDGTPEQELDSVYGEEAEAIGDEAEVLEIKADQLASTISTEAPAVKTDPYTNYAQEMEDTYDASTGAFRGTEYFRIRRIMGMKRVRTGVRYLVDWEGKDPATGQDWMPTWEPKSYIPTDVLAEFNSHPTRKRKRKA